MRKILSLMMAVMFAGSMFAADPEPVKSTFTKATAPSENKVTDLEKVVTWDIATTVGEGEPTIAVGSKNTLECLKFGSSKSVYFSKVEFSTNYFKDYNVTGVKVNVVNNGKKTGTLTAKQGSVTIGTKSQEFGADAWVEMEATGTKGAGGTLTVSYEVAQASYFNYIEVTYEVPEDPEPTEQTLYLKISSDWEYPSKYAVYYFKDNTDNGWSEFMTEVDGVDNTYTTTIPVGYSKIIFARFNSSKVSTGNWDDKWSQTKDQTIPDGKNHFTITSGGTGDECDGTWGVYPVVPTYYVKGSFVDDWATAFELEDGAYTFKDLAAKWYAMKVTDGASEWYGIKDLDTEKSSKYIYGSDNIEFTLAEKGDVTVAFDAKTKKVTVTGNFVAKTTTFTVDVPEGTDSVFVAGSWDNWTAFHKMEPVVGEEDQYKLTIEGEYADLKYKYLAGPDWKYVEDREEDRTWAANDNVTAWKAVPVPPVTKKYAKVKAAPMNWTGHYIISWSDLKPHSAIKVNSNSKDDFIAAEGAPAFEDKDTISVIEGYDINIRFNEAQSAYTMQLPDGKYIYLPNANGVCSGDNKADLYLAMYKGNVCISNAADLTATTTRVIYQNNTNYRSYTSKLETSGYNLPTLYRLVDEAYDCTDGPYALLINSKDTVVSEKGTEGEYTQYRMCASLTKNDKVQVLNASCGGKWVPTIPEGGASKHFKVGEEGAEVDSTGCYDFYFKKKSDDEHLWIAFGICPEDTIRYTVRGKGGILGEDFEKAFESKQDTLELELAVGKYELKVVVGEDWKGFEQLTDTAEGLKVGENDNICFELTEAGKVQVVYNDSVFKLIGDFYFKPVVKKELKLVPGAAWNYDGAKFAAYLWGDNDYQAEWTPFFAGKGDTLKAEINAEADSMVLVRFSDQTTVPSWEKEDDFVWGKIDKIEIDYASLVYTVTSYTTGTWDVYVPAKYYITGDSALVVDAGVDKAKAWNDDAIKSEKDTCVLNLKKDQNYKLKVFAGGKWFGYDKLSKKVDGLNADEDGNINFKLNAAGEVKVVFIAAEKDTTFELIGDFYFKPVVKKELKLVPGAAWNFDGAKFAAYLWGDNDYQAEWTPFFAGKGDTLMTEINAEADSMVLVRFSDQATVPSWEKEDDFVWGKIDKIEIDYASLVYTVTSYTTGTWDVYVPAKYYITGDSALVVDAGVDKAKAWSDDAIKSEKDTCVLNLKKDQNYKLKVVAGGTWLGYDKLSKKVDGLNADEDGNINFKLNAAGEVKVVFIAAEKDTTFELIGDFFVYVPEHKDGFYMMSSHNEWAIDDNYMFAATETEGEYVLNVTLTAGQEIKPAYVEKDAAKDWYGADNYKVPAEYAGARTIYFRPAGNEDAAWQAFGGFFYIVPNDPTGMESIQPSAISSQKVIENGMLIIEKAGVKYNAMGQKIQ